MVKTQTKTQQIGTNPLISPNQTPKLDSKLSKKQEQAEIFAPKSRQQINQENYQKNKAKRNDQAKTRYQQQKEQDQLSTKQEQAKYYSAESIRVLMSLKNYTELNKEKMKLWADFNWTLKDCVESINDIVAVMKLRETAETLINDYWETAKREIRKGKNWNSLTEEQQSRLIKYWGREKARIENGYLDTAEQLARKGQEYEKELELAKFHEERGKKGCGCWNCEESNKIKKEVIKERKKIIDGYEAEQKKSGDYETETVKGECGNCGEYKKVDSDSGLCKKCSESS